MQIKSIIYNKAPIFSIILLDQIQLFMNIRFYRLMLLPLTIVGMVLGSCVKPCDPSGNAIVGEEFFTVQYQDPSGVNYLDIYNPAGIVVFVDTAGGESPNPKFELISPGYEDGKFGPFHFTEKFIDLASNDINLPLLFERPLSFDYYIKKDTYGQDTLTVSFLLSVDECNYDWSYINYFLNGDPLPQYSGQAQANIVIVE